MPHLKQRALGAPQWPVVAADRDGAAVVRGEDDDGVVVHVVLLEALHHEVHRVVEGAHHGGVEVALGVAVLAHVLLVDVWHLQGVVNLQTVRTITGR